MKKLVKSLKFWSRKKKKKKNKSQKNIPTSTITCHHCCCSCPSPSTQPSAPPLPPWYDMSQHNYHEYDVQQPEPSSYPSQAHLVSNEIVVDDKIAAPPYSSSEVLPSTVSSSYQQYTVANPVYGLPVSQAPRRERSAGVFGCVFNSGAHLIRCFCPCFSIRDGY